MGNVLKCLNQTLKYFWFTMYCLVNYNVAHFAKLLADTHIQFLWEVLQIFFRMCALSKLSQEGKF